MLFEAIEVNKAIWYDFCFLHFQNWLTNGDNKVDDDDGDGDDDDNDEDGVDVDDYFCSLFVAQSTIGDDA